MDCSCIKGNYDFILQSLDCSRLLYQDLSDWMIEDYYSVPDGYTIDVLIPNRKQSVPIYVAANKEATVITPEMLGLNSKCIVDGVYCFSLVNCGSVYKKSIAVTYGIECCIDNLIVTSSSKRDEETIKYLKAMLQGAKINAKFGNVEEAHKQIQFITTSLSSLDCNCI